MLPNNARVDNLHYIRPFTNPMNLLGPLCTIESEQAQLEDTTLFRKGLNSRQEGLHRIGRAEDSS
jgi:hypothetical protein